ncbi:hypothetical protein SAY87_022253 [Trapa incisa]|uniref:Uncharacterized protein n=1 Tax=Trapa incisa TaxID=236973 RepID=A0AAN7PXN5_9MYRT|nr:hypothetical protein SAY87_022253 [Trapa incisa]
MGGLPRGSAPEAAGRAEARPSRGASPTTRRPSTGGSRTAAVSCVLRGAYQLRLRRGRTSCRRKMKESLWSW